MITGRSAANSIVDRSSLYCNTGVVFVVIEIRFYPDDSHVPIYLKTTRFTLRPLTPAHVELDHAALMTSKEMLRLWSGHPDGGWPEDDFSIADNLVDLQRHHQEHLAREAFTYTVLNPEETEVIGCVYIVPFTPVMVENPHLAEFVSDDCAMVGFWVIQPRLQAGLDTELLETLRAWFRTDWEFQKVFYNVFRQHNQQIEILKNAGLRQVTHVSRPSRGKFLLFA